MILSAAASVSRVAFSNPAVSSERFHDFASRSVAQESPVAATLTADPRSAHARVERERALGAALRILTLQQREDERLGCASEPRPILRRRSDCFIERFRGLGLLPLSGQRVGADQQRVGLRMRSVERALAVVEQLADLRHGAAAGVAEDDFVFRIEDEQRRPDADRMRFQECGVLGVFRVDREPDKLSGVPLEGFVREDIGPHRAAGVSPRCPRFDEDRKVRRFGAGDRFGVVVLDPRQDFFRLSRGRNEQERCEQESFHGAKV